MARFSFCGPSYESQSPWEDAEKCMNMIPEVMETESAKSRVSLYGVPGYAAFSSFTESPVRAQAEVNGRMFAVVGAHLYEVNSDGTNTQRGAVSNDGNPASITPSQTQLLMVSGGVCYSFDLTSNTFSAITVSVSGSGLTINASGLWVQDTITSGVFSYQLAIQIADNTAVSVNAGQTITIAGAGNALYNATWTIDSSTQVFTGGGNYHWIIYCTATSGLITGGAHLPVPSAPTLSNTTAFNGSAGPNSPTTAASATGSQTAWTSVNNIKVADGAVAQCNLPISGVSNDLQATGYQFGLPSNATILGIVVNVLAGASNLGDVSDGGIFIMKAGSTVGTNHAAGGTWGAMAYRTYGSSTDLWGTTWTPADINAAGFGASVRVSNGNANFVRSAWVDYISITVYYSTPGVTGTLTIGNTYTYALTMTDPGGGETAIGATAALQATGTAMILSFSNIPTGMGVNVYGRTTQLKMATLSPGTTSWVDDGSVTPSGSPPAVSGGGTATPNSSTPLQATMGGYCDGFFLRVLPDSNQFGVSKTLDCTTWDLTDTAAVSIFPDNIVSMLVDHREVWLFGQTKTAVYLDSGNVFPFDVASGGYIEQGCAAQLSPVRADNSIFWIGRDDRGQAIAWRANGYSPQRVSNYGVENAWANYPTISDALSWSYQENGHTHIVFEFPTAGATWVHDASTGMWHERGQWNGTSYGAMNLGWHSFCFGKHLVGDRTTGKIYQMSSSITGFLGDGGTALRWLRIAPWISDESTWTRHDSLQFDCSGGTINLQWSDDGTATWSTARTVTASANQGNLTRLIFRRLGRSRGRIYQAYGTTPVKIMDAYLRATGYEKPTQRLATKMGQMA